MFGRCQAIFCLVVMMLSTAEVFPQSPSGRLDFATAAHHGIFNAGGDLMSPTLDDIKDWVDLRYKELSERADQSTAEDIEELRNQLSQFEKLEEPIVNSILLDALMSVGDMQKPVKMIAVNRVLREIWFKQTLKSGPLLNLDLQTSLPLEIARNSSVAQALSVTPESLSGEEYINTCLESGVDIFFPRQTFGCD